MVWVYSLHSLDGPTLLRESKRPEICRHRATLHRLVSVPEIVPWFIAFISIAAGKKGYFVLMEARSMQTSACLLCASAL